MRPRLLQWLVCPLCHHALTLVVAASERRPPAEVDYHVLEAITPIEDPTGHCSGDSEIAIDRASDGFYTTGPDLFLRRATHVRTG